MANHFGGDFERALKNLGGHLTQPSVPGSNQPKPGIQWGRKAIFDFYFSVTAVLIRGWAVGKEVQSLVSRCELVAPTYCCQLWNLVGQSGFPLALTTSSRKGKLCVRAHHCCLPREGLRPATLMKGLLLTVVAFQEKQKHCRSLKFLYLMKMSCWLSNLKKQKTWSEYFELQRWCELRRGGIGVIPAFCASDQGHITLLSFPHLYNWAILLLPPLRPLRNV